MNYTFVLAEKLSKTQKEITEMGADEFYNWVSFDLLKDEKYLANIKKSLSADMSPDERAKAIKNMFRQLGNVNATNK